MTARHLAAVALILWLAVVVGAVVALICDAF
jgi:hypothetical protein